MSRKDFSLPLAHMGHGPIECIVSIFCRKVLFSQQSSEPPNPVLVELLSVRQCPIDNLGVKLKWNLSFVCGLQQAKATVLEIRHGRVRGEPTTQQALPVVARSPVLWVETIQGSIQSDLTVRR